MGQALYRKYRSRSLEEVVGQEHITSTLASAINHGRISHAYLFTGPRGVGKTSVARILAHAINELPYQDTPHLDIIEIDAASNRRIDDIRDLREKVHIAPVSGKYKVYIIDEVHMLTGESFNALLKTLEEPPSHVVFILATTEVNKLPATIVSRTQRYSFRPGEPVKVMAHLKQVAAQEKIQASDEALHLIAEHGEGSFRDSLSLLDQLANVGEGKITVKTVEQTLGLAPKAALGTVVEAVQAHDYKLVIQQLGELETQGVTTASLVPQLIRVLSQAAPTQPELYRLIDSLLEVPRAYNPSVKLLTVLASFSLKEDTNELSTKHQPALVQAIKPLLEVTKEPSKRAESDEPTAPASKPLTSLTAEQWDKILEAIKKADAPLHAVLRHAQPIFDVTTQVLTLKFKYKLHHKRADSANAKSELARIMLSIFSSAPRIESTLDQSSTTPKSKATLPSPLDETAQSVRTIMGGGEAVNA